MGNVIVGGIIIAIMAISIGKIVLEKKRGAKCIGCPHGGKHDSSKKGCDCK